MYWRRVPASRNYLLMFTASLYVRNFASRWRTVLLFFIFLLPLSVSATLSTTFRSFHEYGIDSAFCCSFTCLGEALLWGQVHWSDRPLFRPIHQFPNEYNHHGNQRRAASWERGRGLPYHWGAPHFWQLPPEGTWNINEQLPAVMETHHAPMRMGFVTQGEGRT
jgi:hypothetical protein